MHTKARIYFTETKQNKENRVPLGDYFIPERQSIHNKEVIMSLSAHQKNNSNKNKAENSCFKKSKIRILKLNNAFVYSLWVSYYGFWSYYLPSKSSHILPISLLTQHLSTPADPVWLTVPGCHPCPGLWSIEQLWFYCIFDK